MDENITRYIRWMRDLKIRFFPPRSKRVEQPLQKSIEGRAPKPEQDVIDD